MKFDQTLKDKLRENLKEFPKQGVDSFIIKAEMLCISLDHYTSDLPKLIDHADEAKKAIKSFKKSIGYLNDIAGGKLPPMVLSKSQVDKGRVNSETAKKAHEVALGLKELIGLFEGNRNTRRGNPGTINVDFGTMIADAFRKYLGEPTASINEPFVAVLELIYEAVPLPYRNIEKLASKILSK